MPVSNFVLRKQTTSKPKLPNEMDPTSKIRSVYVSPFAPNTELSQIVDHLRNHNFTKGFADKTSCVKLVRNNQKKLSFVSFKIDVPEQFYNVISDPALWPSEVNVKEFEQRNKPPRKMARNNGRISKN